MAGTAATDFGGRKATATCSGIVDGCTYLGSAIQSYFIGHLVPGEKAGQRPALFGCHAQLALVATVHGAVCPLGPGRGDQYLAPTARSHPPLQCRERPLKEAGRASAGAVTIVPSAGEVFLNKRTWSWSKSTTAVKFASGKALNPFDLICYEQNAHFTFVHRRSPSLWLRQTDKNQQRKNSDAVAEHYSIRAKPGQTNGGDSITTDLARTQAGSDEQFLLCKEPRRRVFTTPTHCICC